MQKKSSRTSTVKNTRAKLWLALAKAALQFPFTKNSCNCYLLMKE